MDRVGFEDNYIRGRLAGSIGEQGFMYFGGFPPLTTVKCLFNVCYAMVSRMLTHNIPRLPLDGAGSPESTPRRSPRLTIACRLGLPPGSATALSQGTRRAVPVSSANAPAPTSSPPIVGAGALTTSESGGNASSHSCPCSHKLRGRLSRTPPLITEKEVATMARQGDDRAPNCRHEDAQRISAPENIVVSTTGEESK